MTSALAGKRVLLLRAAEQAEDAERIFSARGALPVSVPAIEIGDPPDRAAVLEIAESIDAFDLVVFTSANAVRKFLDVFYTQKSAKFSPKIAAIGPKTKAALASYRLRADIVATEFNGDAFARELQNLLGKKTQRVLLPRAFIARDEIGAALRAEGHDVSVVVVYETLRMSEAAQKKVRALFERNVIDAVIFSSPTTVNHLCDALGADAKNILARVVTVSIGPTTSNAAKNRQIAINAVARESTFESIADALDEFYASPK